MFKKTNRLSKTTAVQAALKMGRGFFNPLFSIRFLSNPAYPSRFTIITSVKVHKRAVKRNRLKRLIREFIRARLKDFRPGDYAIVLRQTAAKSDEQILLKSLNDSFIKWRLLK